MPTYEFECHKGHVTERMVPMGTKVIVCPTCFEEMKTGSVRISHNDKVGFNSWNPMAKRILSPTPTTFKFADRAGK